MTQIIFIQMFYWTNISLVLFLLLKLKCPGSYILSPCSTASSLVMVHNNFHTSTTVRNTVTCLSDGDGGPLSEQKMYRYNFEHSYEDWPTDLSNSDTFISMTDTYARNIRVVRCLGQLPSMDVTGVMGHSWGERKMYLHSILKIK